MHGYGVFFATRTGLASNSSSPISMWRCRSRRSRPTPEIQRSSSEIGEMRGKRTIRYFTYCHGSRPAMRNSSSSMRGCPRCDSGSRQSAKYSNKSLGDASGVPDCCPFSTPDQLDGFVAPSQTVTIAGAAHDDRLAARYNFEVRVVREVRTEAAHFGRRVGAVDREDHPPQTRRSTETAIAADAPQCDGPRCPRADVISTRTSVA